MDGPDSLISNQLWLKSRAIRVNPDHPIFDLKLSSFLEVSNELLLTFGTTFFSNETAIENVDKKQKAQTVAFS